MTQRHAARWTTTELQAVTPGSVRSIRECDVSVVFQPIIDLKRRRIFAHEALARCRLPDFESPAELFIRAEQEQACGRLGRIIRNVLFERCAQHPVFVNVHPQEVSQRWLVQPTDPLVLHDAPVFIEVTEAAAFECFELSLDVLNELRSRCGARVVVDDFGAGHSDLSRVLALKPDLVKLDITLVRDIDRHPEQQAYVEHIIRVCHRLGARFVAEGIERLEELRCVMVAGADLGQGFLLGRPVADALPSVHPPALPHFDATSPA